MKHLNNVNSKLSNKIFSFSLPRETCKHKTKICNKICYALQGVYNYPTNKEHYNSNLRLSESPEFVAEIIQEITSDIKYIRIHPVGDFYSQEYFDKWVNIAQLYPEVTFLAYTRNYDIDCSKKPHNMTLYYSIDYTTKKLNPTIKLKAYTIDRNNDRFKHLQKLKLGRVCNSKNCNKCLYCFKGKGNVIFCLHGGLFISKEIKELLIQSEKNFL